MCYLLQPPATQLPRRTRRWTTATATSRTPSQTAPRRLKASTISSATSTTTSTTTNTGTITSSQAPTSAKKPRPSDLSSVSSTLPPNFSSQNPKWESARCTYRHSLEGTVIAVLFVNYCDSCVTRLIFEIALSRVSEPCMILLFLGFTRNLSRFSLLWMYWVSNVVKVLVILC